MTEEKKDQLDKFLSDQDHMKDHANRTMQFLNGIAKTSDPAALADNLPVGDKIRAIREEKGLSLADAASRTGFEESYLAGIEANEFHPTLGALMKLGKALGMKMGYFISGAETKPFTVTRAEERQQVARRASSVDQAYGYSYFTLAPGKTNRRMEPFHVTLEPSDKENLSTHEGQEFIFVLEGRVEAILEREKISLAPGDSLYFDSTTPHQMRCAQGPSAEILAVIYTDDK